MLIYVDVIIITGSNSNMVYQFIQKLNPEKDLGELHYFLGLDVIRTNKALLFNQVKYVFEILKCASMRDCKSISTSFSTKHNVHLADGASTVLHDNLYRSSVVLYNIYNDNA